MANYNILDLWMYDIMLSMNICNKYLREINTMVLIKKMFRLNWFKNKIKIYLLGLIPLTVIQFKHEKAGMLL